MQPLSIDNVGIESDYDGIDMLETKETHSVLIDDHHDSDFDRTYEVHRREQSFSRRWHDRMFPPNTPRAVQLFRWENLAVPCCYLVVGLLQGLSGPFINVYPLDIGATEAQQTTIASLRSLPASFKLLFGFWSDNVPLWGYRRKSYMFVGWLVTSLSMVLLLLFSDLSPVTVGEDGERIVPEGAPSVPFLSATLLLFGTGFWFADVMADSIVAEKAKLEPEPLRGQLQSTCYACRFFGLMVAAPCSSVVYDRAGPRAVVLGMALLPAFVLPTIYILGETRDVPIRSTRDQCKEIWTTVCSRAVWQPLGFVSSFFIMVAATSRTIVDKKATIPKKQTFSFFYKSFKTISR